MTREKRNERQKRREMKSLGKTGETKDRKHFSINSNEKKKSSKKQTF